MSKKKTNKTNKLIVTKTHYQRAKDAADNRKDRARTCLLAQAIIDKFNVDVDKVNVSDAGDCWFLDKNGVKQNLVFKEAELAEDIISEFDRLCDDLCGCDPKELEDELIDEAEYKISNCASTETSFLSFTPPKVEIKVKPGKTKFKSFELEFELQNEETIE